MGQTGKKNKHKARILVVEDEQFLADIYIQILTDAGYGVERVADGETAYQRIKAKQYDLILLDVMLPGMDGKEIVQRLARENKLARPEKIILMTNLVQDALFSDLRKLGVKHHLIKSDLDPGEFLRAVEKFLD